MQRPLVTSGHHSNSTKSTQTALYHLLLTKKKNRNTGAYNIMGTFYGSGWVLWFFLPLRGSISIVLTIVIVIDMAMAAVTVMVMVKSIY